MTSDYRKSMGHIARVINKEFGKEEATKRNKNQRLAVMSFKAAEKENKNEER